MPHFWTLQHFSRKEKGKDYAFQHQFHEYSTGLPRNTVICGLCKPIQINTLHAHVLGTDTILIIATRIAGITWKEAKLLTGDCNSQQQMLTAQLSTSMLLCIGNSHCVPADFMCQQNTQQQGKSMRLKADTQPQQSAANAMSSTTKLLIHKQLALCCC